MFRPKLILIFATCHTLAAMSMSAISAMDRANNLTDKFLLAVLFVFICAAAHFMLAVSTRPLVWLLWFGCFAGTVWGHFTFLTHANLRAGESRSQHSPQLAGIENQIRATNDALAAIKSRPVTIIAADIASEKEWKARAALKEELSEAKRATALRDEVMRLTTQVNAARDSASHEPSSVTIARLTHSNEDGVSFVANLGVAILMELIGAFLWWEIMRQSQSSSEPVSAESEAEIDQQVVEARAAIAMGKCKLTIREVRKILNCSQTKAQSICHVLKATEMQGEK